ncbi:MAG TPA: hypothetical protein VD860_03395, partial [Azospirillum sp.]|nr:hypothetical protein [Azospirillum sp.]
MIRTSLLAGFATLALLSAPAMAQNVANVSNTAAGIGNVAEQSATVLQKGKGLFAGPNTASVSNTAAGIGNFAGQSALVMQKSKGPFSGGSTATVGNTAAGIGNQALQGATV